MYPSALFHSPCRAQNAVLWGPLHVDMDTVTEGPDCRIFWHFRNASKQPLIIQSVQGSGANLVGQWPKEPIPPGKTGVIEGRFGTSGRSGYNNKTLVVTTNLDTPGQRTLLTVKAYVIPPALNGPQRRLLFESRPEEKTRKGK